jgi:penicillin-binding protein 1A
MLVSRIEDNEGNVVARFEPRVTEVISEESSYKMLALLQGVIDGGTGGRLRFKYGIKAQMGGKTGTTNRNSDAWFMAVAPNLVSGCWVGGEDRDIHFDNMFYGQGASMALPIYAYYIQKVYKDESLPYSENDTFDVPHGYDACASSGGKEDTGPSVEDVFE